MTDALPLVDGILPVAKESQASGDPTLEESSTIADLVVWGLRHGTVQADHPEEPQYGDGAIRSVMGLVVRPPTDMVSGLDALLCHHLVLGVHHDALTADLLPLEDQSRHWRLQVQLREDRSDLPETGADLLRVFARAAAQIRGAQPESGTAAHAGAEHLRRCAEISAAAAGAALGIKAAVHVLVMSNDPGSDLVVFTTTEEDVRDIDIPIALRLHMAGQFPPQVEIRRKSGGDFASVNHHPRWMNSREVAVGRRSGGEHAPILTPMEQVLLLNSVPAGISPIASWIEPQEECER